MARHATSAPQAPPDDAQDPMDTLRGVSQPQRALVRYLQGQFTSKTLVPGGKVVMIKGGRGGR